MMRETSALRRRALLGGALALPALSLARAQGFAPNRPVRLLVGYPPGGATDVLARWVAQNLTPRLGQPVVVENRPGANATIANQYLQGQAPDGHTLIFTTADAHSVNPYVYRRLPYQPERFTPVAATARLLFALVVRPGLGTADARAFVARAKGGGAPLTFASWGIASTSQVMMESFRAEIGAEMTHVPYQGAAPAVQALLADQVDSMMLPIGVALGTGGKLPILGLATKQRFPGAPQVATLIEQGFRLEGDLWLGVMGPPGIPAAIADHVSQQVQSFVRAPEAAQFLVPNGLVADTQDRAAFARFIAEDGLRWKERAERLHVKLDE